MNPFDIKTYVAEAAIEANSLVAFGTDDQQVVPGAADTDLLVGVVISPLGADQDARVDVAHAGIADVELGGNVTRGELVTSDANAKGVTAGPAAGANARYVGVALMSGVSGDIIPIKISLGQAQG